MRRTRGIGAFADLGQIVGHYSTGSVQYSFLYSAGAYITLDDARVVSGINNSGVLVGSYSTHGFFAVPGPNPSPPQNTSADSTLRTQVGRRPRCPAGYRQAVSCVT